MSQYFQKIVMDLDLEKFFDTVNQDLLISIIRKTVNEDKVVSLIRKYYKVYRNKIKIKSQQRENLIKLGILEDVAREHSRSRQSY